MSPPAHSTDEVLTPVATAEALKLAEIQAIRQLGDAVTSQTRQSSEHLGAQTRLLEKLSEKVDDVRERVIALEQSGYDKRLESLKASSEKAEALLRASMEKLALEIDMLKSERDKVMGAASFGTWLTKNAPWLLAGLAAFAAGMGWKFK